MNQPQHSDRPLTSIRLTNSGFELRRGDDVEHVAYDRPVFMSELAYHGSPRLRALTDATFLAGAGSCRWCVRRRSDADRAEFEREFELSLKRYGGAVEAPPALDAFLLEHPEFRLGNLVDRADDGLDARTGSPAEDFSPIDGDEEAHTLANAESINAATWCQNYPLGLPFIRETPTEELAGWGALAWLDAYAMSRGHTLTEFHAEQLGVAKVIGLVDEVAVIDIDAVRFEDLGGDHARWPDDEMRLLAKVVAEHPDLDGVAELHETLAVTAICPDMFRAILDMLPQECLLYASERELVVRAIDIDTLDTINARLNGRYRLSVRDGNYGLLSVADGGYALRDHATREVSLHGALFKVDGDAASRTLLDVCSAVFDRDIKRLAATPIRERPLRAVARLVLRSVVKDRVADWVLDGKDMPASIRAAVVVPAYGVSESIELRVSTGDLARV